MRKGFSFILLLFGILITAFLAAQMARQGVTSTGSDPKTAIDRAWGTQCLVNKATITQTLQIYSIQNEPMKTLDLGRLFPGGFHPSPGSPCSYTLGPSGGVVCKVHH